MKHTLLFIVVFCMAISTSLAQVELVSNGTFEDSLSSPWGAYAASAADVNAFRDSTVAYEGTHSGKIWDHTWGVFLWNDVPGFTDNASYTVSFWYKGDEPMKFALAIGRDLGYDLVTDVDNIVPADANVETLTIDNGGIKWPLPAVAEWTKFTFTWKISNWIGVDPESGEAMSATCAFMFENTSYAVDDGPVTYFDNISIIQTPDNTNAVKMLQHTTTNVYPNPADNSISIKGITTLKSVQIVSSTGQVVKTIYNQENNQINISSLPSGIYSLSGFTAKGNHFVSKFIKK